jgi:hypothetical protein
MINTPNNVVKFPKLPDDRKGSIVDYSVYDFYSYRNRLIEYIKLAYPNDYSFFSESDLGMMFLELVSYMGAVISHKADMLANESFLKTVKTKENLQKILELIGKKIDTQKSAKGSGTIKFSSPIISNGTNYKISANNRSISVTSDLDGGPVTYTIYLVDPNNGTIKNINVINSTVERDLWIPSGFSGSVFSDIAVVEGTQVFDTGEFSTNNVGKSIALSKDLVIEDSVGVFISVPVGGNSQEGGEYKRVRSLFNASGATHKVFSLEQGPDGFTSVVFGDNLFGISPSINTSYTVAYRVGGGERGNKQKESLNFPVLVTNVETVGGNSTITEITAVAENTSHIVGGIDSETVAHAKKYYGSDFSRQGRVVSLQDYISFVNTIEGLSIKATAVTRKAFSSANIIDVFVLSKINNIQLAKTSSDDKQTILSKLAEVKMLTDQPVLCDGLIRTLDLEITIQIDKENTANKDVIKLAVAQNIENYFNVDEFDFGESFIVSDLNKVLYGTNGVRYSTVNNIRDKIDVDFNEVIQLNNYKIDIVEV